MTSSLTVRRYRPADRARVQSLHEETMRAADAFVEDAPDDDLDDVTATYLDAGGDFLVGEREGKILAMGAFRPATGFIRELFDHLPDATAEIKRMRVDPDYQRRGFGAKLYDELERRARDSGVTDLVLDTQPALTAAQRLYEKRGFEQVTEKRIQWQGESLTLLLYRKQL